MVPKPPNLFHFATSELSQDAFIAWLISWADPKYQNSHPALHATAVDLLNAMFDKINHSKPESYESVNVDLQVNHIDLLITINKTIPLIIEDKTYTNDHSGQLPRYVEYVREKFQEFPGQKIPAIYFKIIEQSNLSGIEDAGYKVFTRIDFLNVLRRGMERGVVSDVFENFINHLREIHEDVTSFQKKPIKEWKNHWNAWRGFFTHLQNQFGSGHWGEVSNPRKGFVGFRWNTIEDKYLYLEHGKLKFKLERRDKTPDQLVQEAIRWQGQLKKSAEGVMEISCPRCRQGKHVTVAVIENYLQETSDNRLDIDTTIDFLRTVQQIMNAAAD